MAEFAASDPICPNFSTINAGTFSKFAKQIGELFHIVDKLWPLRQGIPQYGRCYSICSTVSLLATGRNATSAFLLSLCVASKEHAVTAITDLDIFARVARTGT